MEKDCVICHSIKQLGTSHMFSRKHLNTRWDITKDGNCHINCWGCNYKHMYNTYPYNNWYIKKFGQKKFDDLYQRWNTTCIKKDYELEELKETLAKNIR